MAFTKLILIFVVNFIYDSHQRPQREIGIVNGTSIAIEQAPYMAQLMYDGDFICGGSIIHKQFILTAGHCVDEIDGDESSYAVRVGSTEREEGEKIEIEKAHLHEGFVLSWNEVKNDIAIIKLAKPLTENSKASAIKLPNENEEVEIGSLATVTGWGRLSIRGILPTNLQSVSIPILASEECFVEYDEPIADSEICAGSEGKNACKGDSGGPLTLNGKQVGVVSRGTSYICGQGPAVYTKVSAYISWIERLINKEL